MPQTEEEHLENQYLDYEDKEKSITDAEVKSSSINPITVIHEIPNHANSFLLNCIILILVITHIFSAHPELNS